MSLTQAIGDVGVKIGAAAAFAFDVATRRWPTNPLMVDGADPALVDTMWPVIFGAPRPDPIFSGETAIGYLELYPRARAILYRNGKAGIWSIDPDDDKLCPSVAVATVEEAARRLAVEKAKAMLKVSYLAQSLEKVVSSRNLEQFLGHLPGWKARE